MYVVLCCVIGCCMCARCLLTLIYILSMCVYVSRLLCALGWFMCALVFLVLLYVMSTRCPFDCYCSMVVVTCVIYVC